MGRIDDMCPFSSLRRMRRMWCGTPAMVLCILIQTDYGVASADGNNRLGNATRLEDTDGPGFRDLSRSVGSPKYYADPGPRGQNYCDPKSDQKPIHFRFSQSRICTVEKCTIGQCAQPPSSEGFKNQATCSTSAYYLERLCVLRCNTKADCGGNTTCFELDNSSPFKICAYRDN